MLSDDRYLFPCYLRNEFRDVVRVQKIGSGASGEIFRGVCALHPLSAYSICYPSIIKIAPSWHWKEKQSGITSLRVDKNSKQSLQDCLA